MKKLLSILTGIALCGAAAFGAETKPGTAGTPPLKVGVSPVFPPMIFKQGKELAGVEVDLARALGRHLGREVQFVEVPWKDQIEALNARKTDIIMSSMSITMARRYMVDFSKPYCGVAQLALVRTETKNDYALGFPVKPKGTIGVIRATTGEFLVQRDFSKSKYKAFDNGEAAASALIKKKIGMFVSDSTLVWYLAGLHAADGLSAVPIPLSEEALGWAVRKGDDELLSKVNGFLDQCVSDGTLQKALRRWTAVGD